MQRIESPWGRVYKAENGLLLPSTTTVLKATEKGGFSRNRWSKKLTSKGLTEYEASLFAEYFVANGHSWDVAYDKAYAFIGKPMNSVQANVYMTWKSEHSSNRGTKLHDFLEHRLPVGQIIQLDQCPEANDPATQNLVDSLWKGGILQKIKYVHSVEERLWWYANGIGYAGTEDIAYRTWDDLNFSSDWKSKDPKDYCHSAYDHEYRVQLVSYAGARFARKGMKMDGLHINFCHSDGSPGVQSEITGDELIALWDEWMFRLQAWWTTIGPSLLNWRYA